MVVGRLFDTWVDPSPRTARPAVLRYLTSATAGTFALKPADNMLDALRRDYEAMAGMIIGRVPRFDDVMVSITSLEEILNEPEQSPSS